MAEELYALTAGQVIRLKRLLEAVESGSPIPLSQQATKPRAATVLVGILTDQISATTGLATKPKVGVLNVYSFTSTGTVDTGIDETVYSFAPHAATTDRWSVAERDAVTGYLVLTTQYCS